MQSTSTKASTNADAQSRLEARANRFGPVTAGSDSVVSAERKAARAARFADVKTSSSSSVTSTAANSSPGNAGDSSEEAKRLALRAARFGVPSQNKGNSPNANKGFTSRPGPTNQGVAPSVNTVNKKEEDPVLKARAARFAALKPN